MEKFMNDYLEKIERYLKPLPASERIDIVKEIKSEMLELQHDGKSEEEMLERLSSPKELAKAYLGESIAKTTKFRWKKLGAMMAFYSLAGTAWMFVLPFTSLLGIALMACGVATPIAGMVRLIAFLVGHDIPQIGFTVGSFSASAIAFLPISIVCGVLFFLLGKLFWNLTIKLIKSIGSQKNKIQDRV